MAQPGINAKIEELQFRIKTDPKSRLFFPLAEELRKHGRLPEAEQVLRTGLHIHATYLSAWVSLGRVLREQGKNRDAVEALTMALQVDPGNVVAARLLADTYYDLGEKIEAIKKYKLVHALMPGDEELQAKIDSLDREIQAPEGKAASSPASEPAAVAAPVSASIATSFEQNGSPIPEPEVVATDEGFAFDVPSTEHATHDQDVVLMEPEPAAVSAPSWDKVPPVAIARVNPYQQTMDTPFDTGDDEPMSAHHVESPFESTAGYSEAALAIEQPEGIHIEEPFLAAGSEDPWASESEPSSQGEPAAGLFASASTEDEERDADDDVTSTTTMADLYVRQGLIGEARKIYEHVLQRDPSDADVRAKLEALSAAPSTAQEDPALATTEEQEEPVHADPRILALQRWLGQVGRRGEGRV